MTLVMFSAKYNMQLLMGDTLLSNKIPNLFRPNTADSSSNLKSDENTYPSSQIQKIMIIRDWLVIGWAGLLSKANIFVSELQQLCPNIITCREDFGSILEKLTSHDENDFQAIAWIYLDGEINDVIGINTVPFMHDESTSLLLIGSGTPDIYQSYLDTELTRPVSNIIEHVANALGFMNRANAAQYYNNFGFNNGWGGGLEIIVRTPNGFTKIGNCLMRTWTYDSETKEFSINDKSYLMHYIGEYLFFISIKYGNNPEICRISMPNSILKSKFIKRKMYFHIETTIDTIFNKNNRKFMTLVDRNTKGIYNFSVEKNGDYTMNCRNPFYAISENLKNDIDDFIRDE